MRLSAAERRAKLATLITIEGYGSIEDLAQAVLSDSVSPAICMNEDCDFTCEMEPDQDAGCCEEVPHQLVQSALILAGIIQAPANLKIVSRRIVSGAFLLINVELQDRRL
jgi:hypothetical protein